MMTFGLSVKYSGVDILKFQKYRFFLPMLVEFKLEKALKHWLQYTLKLKPNITIRLSIVNSSIADLISKSIFQKSRAYEKLFELLNGTA